MIIFQIQAEEYNGQILAFEHCAIRHRLDRNSTDLAKALERVEHPLELDVIGLSRGACDAKNR